MKYYSIYSLIDSVAGTIDKIQARPKCPRAARRLFKKQDQMYALYKLSSKSAYVTRLEVFKAIKIKSND